MSLWSFQGARETGSLRDDCTRIRRHSLSKLSSVRSFNVEVDVVLGELNSRTVENDHQRVQRLPA